jgi:hypothetical protein
MGAVPGRGQGAVRPPVAGLSVGSGFPPNVLPSAAAPGRVNPGRPVLVAARRGGVRLRVGPVDGAPTATWINKLTLGDSAGRRVMRWVTR